MPVIFAKKENRVELLKCVTVQKRKSSSPDYNRTRILPSCEEVIRAVAEFFGVKQSEILRAARGQTNNARKVSMYGCRFWAQEKLNVIAKKFNCCNLSSIGNTVREVENRIKKDNSFSAVVKGVKNKLDMMQVLTND